MDKKVEPLSTVSRQKRYIIDTCRSAGVRLAVSALLFWSLTAPGGRLHAEEAPLPAEFLEYLGTVEGAGLTGGELLDLDEIYRLLQKLVREVAAKKKNGTSNGKESEHGDAPKK